MKNYREIFNPSKITISGKSKIVNTESGKYVIKPRKKDIKSLYDYLLSRSFKNFPKVIDEFEENYVYEYIDDGSAPINQKCEDMASLLASLHYKTAFYETKVKDDIKEVYELLNNNIIYMKSYFEELFKRCESEVYPSPSYYLLLRNRTKIDALSDFLSEGLEKWYNLAINDEKERVVYCHNNLSIDHFLEGKDKYFISWDNYRIDTPVLDLVNLYKNDYNKYDFSVFLDTYLNNFPLNETEKKLLFTVISLPKIPYFNEDEFKNTVTASKFIDYIFKTEKLIRPYYFVKKKE